MEYFKGSDEKINVKLVIYDEYLTTYTSILIDHCRTRLWYIDTGSGTEKTTIEGTNITLNGLVVQVVENYTESFDRFYYYEPNLKMINIK